jgi:hypothetical protein
VKQRQQREFRFSLFAAPSYAFSVIARNLFASSQNFERLHENVSVQFR